MKATDLAKLVLSVLLMWTTLALAVFDPVNDDTDIFLANPNIAAERPNVLIVVDNSANWNTPFTNEKNALVQVINGLSDQYNVGLMIMSDANIKRSGTGTNDGGYVRYHVRQMTLTNKSRLATIVANFDVGADKGDNNLFGLALYEAYLYFAGKSSLAGDDQSKADFDGTSDPQLTPLTGHALPSPGTATGFPAVNSTYRSPIVDGCARNFVIYISNGPAAENAAARDELQGYLATLTGVNPPAQISIAPNGLQGNWADELAKLMANADVMATSAGIPNSSNVQNVYTYVVEVDPGTTGQGPDMTALAKSVAANGKGKYFGVTSSASGTGIVDALNAIFTEVQAVNSVFASTTLPVSVNVRGTNLNQVYIGVFRPDSTKKPRWLGNLKMYNLALNTSTGKVFLADAARGAPPAIGNPAENSATGFVSQTSPSFWSASSSFWGWRDPSANGPGGASDKPDGDLVEKGGAAQQLRVAFAAAEATTTPRKLYTCTTGLVNSVAQDCQPITGFQLTKTPFSTLNDAITTGALDLDTRLVSPLTAYSPKTVTNLTDRLQLWSFTNTSWTGIYVPSLDNGANSRTLTSLNTSQSQVVTSATSDVPNTQSVAITNIKKVSGQYVVTAAAAIPANFANTSGGTPRVTITGNSVGTYNAIWDVSSLDTTAKTFEINVTGNVADSTGGSAAMTNGVATSTTAVATLGGHGFTSGQSVTISGSTAPYNGTFNVTVIDSSHFSYTMLSAPGSTGTASGPILATGNSTVATATTSGAHTFLAGTTVTIVGASDAAYNGPKTILASPAPTATTFSYSVGATPIGPNTNTVGVSASQSGGTTVTVTTAWAHEFSDTQTIHIGGSEVSGYNGSFPISCPTPDEAFLGACGPGQPHTKFTYTTASVLPANTSFNVYAASDASRYIWAYVPHHGLQDGDEIQIEGPAPFAGTYNIFVTLGSDYYFYIDTWNTPVCNNGVGPCQAITQTGYTVRSTGGINIFSLASGPRLAYATLPAHGYPNSQEVRIDGANPTAYNGVTTIRTCTDGVATTRNTPVYGAGTWTQFCGGYQTGRFNYTLASAPGANTSLAVTSSIKSTLARATSVNHGFTNGSTVVITGAVPGAFEGPYTITVVNSNNFTYTLGSVQGDASGTIKASQTSGASPERDNIIRWVRGEDNFEDENQNLSTTDIRASVHGDVLHSRPAVINYNRFSGSDDDVFIYYGANDGVFHAVKGGYAVPSGDTSGYTPGQETWGFVAKEFFGKLKRLRNNAPLISSAFKRPYFMDGSIGVYTKDDGNNKLGDDGDTVNLYIANRRGGRFLYALDVNKPLDPKFLWRVDTSSTGFSELGQTWSQPNVVTNLASLTVPVLVFGAGYDPAVEDIDPALVTSVDTNTNGAATNGAVTTASGTVPRSMGRGIYVVHALTGALVWSAGRTGSGATLEVPGMIYAIPSDVTVVRNESGGAPNRAYVGDTGGNLWRIDFKSNTGSPSPNLALSTVTKLASVANQSTAAGRRKFQFQPDVVGQTGGFDAVLIGSGDREHPFDTTVTNRFYMFKDKGGDSGAVTGTTACDPTITEAPIADPADACPPNPGAIAGLSDLTSNCLQQASACLAGETQAAVSTKLGTDRGWFITLGTGEKVVGNAISLGGTTFFNTNQPSASAGGGACGSNLGIARQYQVATADATATTDLNAVGGLTGADRSLTAAGGGYLPSPVQVVVTLGGKPVQAVISGIQVSTPAGATLSARLRKYWYKEVDPK